MFLTLTTVKIRGTNLGKEFCLFAFYNECYVYNNTNSLVLIAHVSYTNCNVMQSHHSASAPRCTVVLYPKTILVIFVLSTKEVTAT